MESSIVLDDVSKSYEIGDYELHVLQDISLDIKKGEFIAIKGPSGAGKSTWMNMIGSLDVPSSGNIILDGNDLSNLSESELAVLRGKKIGFVFQNFNLIPSLSAFDNVSLPLIFQDIKKEKRDRITKEILERVGLKDRVNHKPSELSGGERQRVAIARALVNDPEIILADEPTGNLDSKTGKEIMKLLINLNKEGKTLIVITHDDSIAKLAKRVINLKDGKITK
ncbi:ABC transporter ATP-binding protein [archaeon]|jgi:putative ABC transport system ATP-binding protein|nr:ABC transporter ATP-binding protein [archaeon]MBT6824313.1 ABC transporter ATP-binding protein [archaeon]MBT7297835.1 ABC transporter ATP-binding protein [archaeon]